MNLRGRRIHIAGSASLNSDERKLRYGHDLILKLMEKLSKEGAIFIVPFGKEPFHEQAEGLSVIFDWTIAQSIHQALKSNTLEPSNTNGRLIKTIATSKTDGQIPDHRREIYNDLRVANAITIEFIEPGWSAGGYRRTRLAQSGDILIGISGGEGVEHLAVEYSKMGKPVIPLDINLGSSQSDGSGGSSRLFERALVNPNDFFSVSDKHSAAEMLDRTRTLDGTKDLDTVVTEIIGLLHALTSPKVFYVRLLNNELPDFDAVETYFRGVVDPVIEELGYQPIQMGIGKNEFAWMNQAIFDSLHHSSVVFVDLTTLRPNCFVELGYALGNRQKVILTAKAGTQLPFDVAPLETFMWQEEGSVEKRKALLKAHWERNIDMPAIVKPKEAK